MSEATSSPRRSTTLAAAALLSMVFGCDPDGGGRGGSGPSSTGGKGDNLGETETDGTGGDGEPASDHRAAVLLCEAAADHVREHVSAERVDAIVDLERNRNDCLVTANDGTLGTLEGILTAAGDPYAGQALPAFKAHRTDAIGACNVLIEAHPEAASGALSGISATCIGDLEADLAAILDAHADLGVAPFSIPAARDRYPSCYAAFDDEVANAPGVDAVAESAIANDSLASCIRDTHDAALPEFAARVAAAFPGRDVAQVEQDARDAIASLALARQRTCEVAVHAGPGRAAGGFVATIAECAVDLAIQSGELLDVVAPGLLDGGSDGGTDGGGTDDGGTTG